MPLYTLTPFIFIVDNTKMYDKEVALIATEWDLTDGVLNPNDVSYETYEKMIYGDAQVGAASLLFKLALLSKGWDIQYPDYDKGNKDLEKLAIIRKMFINVNRSAGYRGGLRAVIEEMLNTPLFGFSVTEIVYEYDKDLKIYKLSKLKPIPQSMITFKIDKAANLKEIIQSDPTTGEPISLKPLEKFIVWTFQRNGKNIYGNGLLNNAYKHWYIKNFLIKQWGIYLEKKANPVPVVKTKKSRFAKISRMLSNLNSRSYAIIEHDDEFDIITPKDVGGQYRDAIRYQDTMIFRSMLTPTLLLGQEDVGARALGNTHLMTFMWIVNKMKEDLKNIMDELIRNIWKVNWGENDIYPVFYVPDLSDDDIAKFADIVEKMIKAEVFQPDEDWIRKRLGAPIYDESLAPKSSQNGEGASLPPSPKKGDVNGK